MKSKPNGITLTPDFFERADIREIEDTPEGIRYLWVYIKLLALSAVSGGELRQSDGSPYTSKTLGAMINTTGKITLDAVHFFQQIGMIHITEDKTVIITEAQRMTGANHAERAVRVPYQQIADLFNELCPAYPKIKKLSDARKREIKARFEQGYTVEDFRTAFNNAQNNSFLRGEQNGDKHKNWRASFDWIIGDRNMPRVLENAIGNESTPQEQTGSFNFAAFERESVYSTPTL